MLQRIQSVFLLLTAVVTALMFFMPVALLVVPNAPAYEFYTTKVLEIGSISSFITWNWMSLILNILITALAFITIFLYKKRFLQLRLCIVNIILMLGMIVLMWLQVSHMTHELEAESQLRLSFCFPLVGIILTWLALRGIIKDIALLKSYDRIR